MAIQHKDQENERESANSRERERQRKIYVLPDKSFDGVSWGTSDGPQADHL